MLIKSIMAAGVYLASITFAQAAAGATIEDSLRNATSQVPALVVLVILAVYFLRAMGAKDKEFAEAASLSRKDYLESLKSLMASHQAQWDALHAEQMASRKETQAIIERQIEAMRLMSSAIATCPGKGHSL